MIANLLLLVKEPWCFSWLFLPLLLLSPFCSPITITLPVGEGNESDNAVPPVAATVTVDIEEDVTQTVEIASAVEVVRDVESDVVDVMDVVDVVGVVDVADVVGVGMVDVGDEVSVEPVEVLEHWSSSPSQFELEESSSLSWRLRMTL